MKPTVASLLLLGIGFQTAVVCAQGPGSGNVVVSGSIPRAIFLASAASAPDVEVRSTGLASLGELRLRVRSPRQLPVSLSLLARSNTSYRISVRMEMLDIGSLPEEPANVVLSSVTGTGARVTAGATDARVAPRTELKTAVDTVLIEGSRISRSGNNSSPDNALRMEFSVTLPGGVTAADLVLRMEPVV